MNKQNFSIKTLLGGGLIRVIIISFFATLACVGIIKAATTIGTNISTGGTITGSGVNNLYGATSVGGALTATSTLTVQGASTLSTSTISNLTVSGNAEFNHQLNIDSTNQLISAFERVANGSFFESAYGWTLGSGWSYSGSKIVKTAGNTNTASQSITIEAGRTYIVTYKLTPTSGTGVTVSLGGTSGTQRTATGTWGEEITAASSSGGIVFTPTSDFAGNIDNVRVFDKQMRGMGITGESTGKSGWNGMGILELYAIHSTESAVDYGNTLYSESSINATANSTPQVNTITNGYFQTRFEPPTGSMGILGALNNMSTSIVFNSGGSSHSIPSIAGQTIAFGEGNASIATYNINDWKGLSIADSNLQRDSGTFNITNLYDLYLSDMVDFEKGTTGTSTGIWLEPMTIGTTNRGIILDGNGAGSDIVFGDSQQLSMSRNSTTGLLDIGAETNLTVNFGSKSVCSAWATITNPYMCISWLTPATTETAIVASSTVFSSGLQFAYNNITASEVAPKSLVWTLNGAGGTEYLSRTDSGSAFSFIDTGSNGFSVAAWVEVTDTAGAQTIIAKSGAAGNREWLFQILNDETLVVALTDQSASVLCTKASSGALPSIGSWHLLSFVYDGSGGDNVDDGVTIYDNGVAMSASNPDCTGYVAMEDLAQNVTIGAQGNPSNYFKGDMGHVMITDDELTADQILKLYNSSKMYYGL
jgi:hypothetical protein